MSSETDHLQQFLTDSGVPHVITAITGTYVSAKDPCHPHAPGSYHCRTGTNGLECRMTLHQCAISGCSNIEERLICGMHRQRSKRHGDYDWTRPTPAERFAANVKQEGSCHIWQLGCDQDGYGSIKVRGVGQRAHRFAWELVHGPIPDGLLVLHACDNPPCVNVNHLFLGTFTDNNRDREAKGRGRYAHQTHCLRGHPYNEANLYVTAAGHRSCRACGREHARRYRAARMARES